jgi:hypothetical protein
VPLMWAPFRSRAMSMKARLVMLGNRQPEGTYGDTFAPVARAISRMIICVKVVSCKGAKLAPTDVSAAYLNGKMIYKLYTGSTPGFEKPEHRGYARQILKGIYGGKEAGVLWRNVYHPVYMALGFVNNRADSCVYNIERGSEWLSVAVIIDDGFTGYFGRHIFVWYLNELNKHFKINASTNGSTTSHTIPYPIYFTDSFF